MKTEALERCAQRKQKINELRRRHTKDHYLGLGKAKAQGVKVSWSVAGIAPSLVDALGMAPCSPENYCALCASKQTAGKYCEAAQARGIPPDVCSYGRCIMGMMWENDGPFGPLPAPDIVILDPSPCDAHAKMWEIPGQYFNVPSFRIDGTHFLDGRITQRDIDYRVSELHRLVAFCEDHLGVKFDLDRFKENTRREAQVRALLNEVQTLRKAVPCPRSTRDMISEIFYIAAIPHTEEAVEYMSLVAEDCRDRVEHGIGAIDNERFRIYYDNIPLWFWLQFYDYLEERGAVFVSDSYSNTQFNGYYSRGYQLDPEQPFESLARRQMFVQASAGVEPNLDVYASLIEDWHCDGVVLFVNRSCKMATAGRYDKKNMFNRRFGIPILEFEGEMADPLTIDKEDVIERAKVFLEMLEARRAAKQQSAPN